MVSELCMTAYTENVLTIDIRELGQNLHAHTHCTDQCMLPDAMICDDYEWWVGTNEA